MKMKTVLLVEDDSTLRMVSVDECAITEGLDMEGDDHIVKPFRLPVLLSRIRAVLRRYAED